jgi:nucleoside-diphosphate-sugar epimerase
MSKKILILGGAGYVGDHLVSYFLNANLECEISHQPHKYEIFVYDSLLFEKDYLRPFVNFIFGDIRDKNRLLPYLQQADVVINLAAHVGDQACAIDPEVSYDVNVECLQWIRDNFDGLLVWPSSCSVYGTNDNLVNEESPVNPLSLYAETKVLGEDLLNKSGKPNLILRLGTLFGRSGVFCRQRFDLVGNILPCKAYFEKKLTVFGGEQYRPILNVVDVAAFIFYYVNLNQQKTGTYNLGGYNTTLLNLAKIIQNRLPEAQIVETNIPTEDLRNYKVDDSKARKELNYFNLHGYDEHITIMLSILASGRIVDWKHPIYHNANWFKQERPYLIQGGPEVDNDSLYWNPFPYNSRVKEKLQNLKLTSVI